MEKVPIVSQSFCVCAHTGCHPVGGTWRAPEITQVLRVIEISPLGEQWILGTHPHLTPSLFQFHPLQILPQNSQEFPNPELATKNKFYFCSLIFNF